MLLLNTALVCGHTLEVSCWKNLKGRDLMEELREDGDMILK
jgi:hypothetical protein